MVVLDTTRYTHIDMEEKLKSKPQNYKVWFVIAFCIALLEGWYIYRVSDLANVMTLPPYMFTDMEQDGLVTAYGSWISSQTDLAFPVSTVYIECRKELGHCWVANATVMESSFLFPGFSLHEIQYWNDDFIETKPSDPGLGCVEETYRLDRRSETVSHTRRTIDNVTGLCEGIQEEPITATLGHGMKRIEVYRNSK